MAGWGLARRAAAVAPAGARTTSRDICRKRVSLLFAHYAAVPFSPLPCSAAAWDTVEELSAAASHAKASGSGDPLEDVSVPSAQQQQQLRQPHLPSAVSLAAWRIQSHLVAWATLPWMAVGFICSLCPTSGRSQAAVPVLTSPPMAPLSLAPAAEARRRVRGRPLHPRVPRVRRLSAQPHCSVEPWRRRLRRRRAPCRPAIPNLIRLAKQPQPPNEISVAPRRSPVQQALARVLPVGGRELVFLYFFSAVPLFFYNAHETI